MDITQQWNEQRDVVRILHAGKATLYRAPESVGSRIQETSLGVDSTGKLLYGNMAYCVDDVGLLTLLNNALNEPWPVDTQ